MQPVSPPKQSSPTSSTHPFPSSISGSSIPIDQAPNPFGSAPVNSRKATNEEMARSAKWAKTQRAAEESVVAEIDGGGHLLRVLRQRSRYVVDESVVAKRAQPKPSTSHDARSSTAVGSNDPWSSPTAGSVTSSLTAGGELFQPHDSQRNTRTRG